MKYQLIASVVAMCAIGVVMTAGTRAEDANDAQHQQFDVRLSFTDTYILRNGR